jgi:chemotaxis protein CheZ
MSEQGQVDDRLAQARELVRCLEAGDADQADRVLNELTRLQEGELFLELGRLTRQLHEAINGFLLDERLQEIAEHEIKDAAERLRYVIDMTEKSANSTLNAVEAGMPVVLELQEKARQIEGEWTRFRNRELDVEEFRRLSASLSVFLSQVGSDGETLHGRLSEVLMAQDFQDLTGQIIRKVIDLVQDVEDKLVQIIRISGAKAQMTEKAEASPIEAAGPVVPGVDKGEVVHGQDEVDDLLSSLGF